MDPSYGASSWRRCPAWTDENFAGLAHTTLDAYASRLKKHIFPKWSEFLILDVKPSLVQDWLNSLQAAPKSKGHLKALMHRLFEKAMLWELLPVGRNPMELVEVRGVSRRRKKPRILTVEEFFKLAALIPEPYSIMIVVAQCTGLRASEILALEWKNIDLDGLVMLVRRGVVHGRVRKLKTECSEDDLPLDPDFATVLR
ncbi:MAG: hypothetical protein DMG61_14865, partial [Acidobacteria bacterium]